MKLRVFVTLLMAITTLTASVSPAQMQWGAGMYGGMQPCAVSTAGGASSEDDETAQLKQDRVDLRREKRDIEKNFRQLERDIDEAKDQITEVIKPSWARVITNHMDKGMNCNVCGSEPVMSAAPAPPPPPYPATVVPQRDTSTKITITTPPPAQKEEVPMDPDPRPPKPRVPDPIPVKVVPPKPPGDEIAPPRLPAEPPPKEKPKRPRKLSQIENVPSRMPAAEAVGATASSRVAGPAQADFNGNDDFGPDFGANSSAGGGKTLCYTEPVPYGYKAWRRICEPGGKINSNACTESGFQRGEIKKADESRCSRALGRYRRLVVEMEKAQNRLAKIDDEIDRISWQLKDIKTAERANRDLESDCPTGRCGERGSSTTVRTQRGPTIGQTLLQVGTMLGLGYLGYKTATHLGDKAIEMDGRTGNQVRDMSPYVALGVGMPFALGGMYGGMYGGVNGGFGCSPGIGGFGTMGPGGYVGVPGMYGNVGGAFGYPNGMMPNMYPQYGGGAFMPGAGPWGVNGPWGVGTWPGGYPGYGNGGWVGSIAGSVAVGVPGYGGYPQFGGGAYPGLAAGAYGGYPQYGGYPGFGGIPIGGGVAGAIAGSLAVGVPGYGGYPQYGGYPYGAGAGAYPPYGYPGYAGGYQPAFAGAIAGGYVGAPGGYGVPGYGLDPALAARQAEAAASRARLYQSYMQELSSFQSKWSQYFGSGGFGGSTSFDYGLPSTTTIPTTGGSGPTTTTTPGRTR